MSRAAIAVVLVILAMIATAVLYRPARRFPVSAVLVAARHLA